MKSVDVVKAINLIDEQAKDETLWVHPETIVEAYLQKALRRLHAVLEGDEVMLAVLDKEE